MVFSFSQIKYYWLLFSVILLILILQDPINHQLNYVESLAVNDTNTNTTNISIIADNSTISSTTSTISSISSTSSPIVSTTNVECGRFANISGSIHRDGRIIGGKDALIEEFPWHGSLQKLRILLPLPIPDWRHICGASIINQYWLITAGHCVDGLLNSLWPGQLRLVLGTDRWRYTLLQRNIQTIPVSKIIIHPRWSSRKAQNDIAMIKTTKPIQFNNKVQPICLPSDIDYQLKGGQSVTVAGYGYTTDNLVLNFLPDRLKAVKVPVVRTENCQKTYNISRIPITDKMICAGITTYGRCSGAMRGDSGSALITYDESGRAIHTGIVSFSLPCRVFGAPDVYTKTSAYLPWIQATMKNN